MAGRRGRTGGEAPRERQGAMPAISAIIPTYRRPQLVTRAVRSALAQTDVDLEVVVVIDGLDDATREALGAIGDPRLRPVTPPRNLGNAGARNFGIAAAAGAWIALLDDDDSWAPGKLAHQMARARALEAPLPLICCRFEAVGEGARYVWPRVLPRPGQPVGDYLFTRRGPSVEGAVQTSTFLAPKALFEAVPFDADLGRYVDLDWLLRAARRPGFVLAFAEGPPLSRYSVEAGRARISNERDWQRDVDWIRARRHLVTDRAYAGYLLTQASIRAELSRDKGAFWPLLSEAVRAGRPSAGELAFHALNTFLPRAVRRRLSGTRSAAGAG